MATKAYGRMLFWEGACLWVLQKRPGDPPYPKTSFHAHHAVQVTLALHGSFTLEGREQHAVGVVAAAVAPDVEHTFEAHGDAVAHLFVDPDGHTGRELHPLLETQGASTIAEYHAFPLGSAEIRAAGTFGAYPVRVLTGTDHPVSPAREELWETMLGELAAEASNGEQIIVRGAGHYIQLDRPDVVVQAILEMLPTP